MKAYVLIAGLWAAVLVYWLWARRPSTADTVGLFRRELGVLRTASPQRVAPANRLDPNRPVLGARVPVGSAGQPVPLAAAAASYRRMEMRKRRRDVLCVLAGGSVLTLLLAVLTGSAWVIALQVICDFALGGYVALLFRAVVSGSSAFAPASRRDGRVARRVVSTQAREPEQYDETDYFASAVLTGVEHPPLAARMARRTAAPTRPGAAVTARAATVRPASASAARPDGRQRQTPAARQHGAASPVGRHSIGGRSRVDYDLTAEGRDVDVRDAVVASTYGDFDDYEALAIAN
ncbi:MAG TPA: hypothetical protein VFN61_00900 [Acidimicrobiales bacterium]|nr:hypothetical protein [Acidimicrobiales bacterium]